MGLPTSQAICAELQLPPVANVLVDDVFWRPRLDVLRDNAIPNSWNYMGWNLRSLSKAAGLPYEGDLNGTWDEANLYKFLETCAYSLALFPDPELQARVDEIAHLLKAIQRPDGFVHVYIINEGKLPWDPAFLGGSHEGYVLGHLIEAALEYEAATGRPELLEVARKAADQAWENFLGSKGTPGFCGHAELEMALVELYRRLGDHKYLDLSRAFVEWRGQGLGPGYGETPREYFQDGAPVRKQLALEGHAVRAVFFATGVTDLALETGDPDYRLAANRFWDSATHRRMYVTGSLGARSEHEALGEDYELPLEGYTESCAACGLADFAQRMFLLERQAEAADTLERVLYNAVLHGIALDGLSTYYRNPLSDHDHLRDNCWVCCPPNLSRTVFQIGRYAYACGQREAWINLYVGGVARATAGRWRTSAALRNALPLGG